MQRIAIIGSAGAGKSTLARQVGERLGIEVIHLDRLYWKPGWEATPRAEWVAIQQELIARPTWIIDGHYGSTLDPRLEAADAILFLDLPRSLCLWRALKRYLTYRGRSRPDLNPGCPEAIDWAFVKWIWAFPRRSRPALLARLERYADRKQVVRLRSPRQVAAFLQQLDAQLDGDRT